jgi:GTP-binding protein HflX
LEKVRAHRQRHRVQRQRNAVPVVAIVGYTNAGKSTLLNALVGTEEVLVADQLFATLDPTTRRVRLPNRRVALFTDTVGFIQKLPTTLVAAFRATLEEIGQADLLLHVVDATHPNVRQQIQAVQETLAEINSQDLPTLVAFNKMDQWSDGVPEAVFSLAGEVQAIPISALTGNGLVDLTQKIEAELFARLVPLNVTIPYKAGQFIALYHEQGVVERTEHLESGVLIEGRVPQRVAERFRPYVTKPKRRRLVGKA